MAKLTTPQIRKFKGGYASLVALLLPALLFSVGLVLVKEETGYTWIAHLPDWPWELWGIAACGVVATLGGLGDWYYHRKMSCQIGRSERRCELLALAGGGLPLFVCMAAASIAPRPALWLLPAVVAVLFTAVLICYDEFVFHRKRCRRFETLLHRLLVFGNAAAWLAWSHWCFVRPGGAIYYAASL